METVGICIFDIVGVEFPDGTLGGDVLVVVGVFVVVVIVCFIVVGVVARDKLVEDVFKAERKYPVL